MGSKVWQCVAGKSEGPREEVQRQGNQKVGWRSAKERSQDDIAHGEVGGGDQRPLLHRRPRNPASSRRTKPPNCSQGLPLQIGEAEKGEFGKVVHEDQRRQ